MSNRRIVKKRNLTMKKEAEAQVMAEMAVTAAPEAEQKEAEVNFFIQYQGKEVLEQEIMAAIEKAWEANGRKKEEIEKLDVYYKPEEEKAYYVINDGQENGSLAV